MGEKSSFRLTCITPALLVRDLQRTLDFYRDALGFELDSQWLPDEPSFCILDHGDVHLSFTTERYGGTGRPRMTGQLRIDTDDAMAVYERVKGRGEIEWGPEVFPYGRREFSVRDPDGYSLIFSQVTEDPPTDSAL